MEEQDLKQKIAEFLETGEGFKNENVKYLDISVRTLNCLFRNRIKYLEDANGMSVEKLKKIRNMGEKGIAEFLEAAERCGYAVKDGRLVRKFELEENQTDNNEESILIDDTELSDRIKQELKSYGCQYISDIADSLFFKGYGTKFKAYIEELKKEMAKYGYILNKIGFFIKNYTYIYYTRKRTGKHSTYSIKKRRNKSTRSY